jgi:uncharacterized damage-inducible protein DinB
MKIADLQLLFDYNYWANGRILSASSALNQTQFATSPDNSLRSLHHILLHILDAEYGWRVMCQHNTWSSELTESDFPTVAALVQRWQAEEADMRNFLASLQDDDLTRIVSYTLDSGEVRERVLWHCLHHVVNHGTQHRSEAAVLLTDYGQSPGDFDFTVFLNEKVGASS